MKKLNNEKRTKKLVDLFQIPRNKTKRLAYRYLFSTLKALEDIAVLAAERGAGVEGQLEDEYVHRDTFKQLADLCGGYEFPCEFTQKLIDYLQSLKGKDSVAALNVVAEGWLGCVFKGLSKVSPELFHAIGQDEARHNGYALTHDIPDSEYFEPVIRNLEKLLFDIVKSPNFIIPMIYLIGMKNVGLMGLDMLNSHKLACDHLKIESDTKDIRKFCKRAIIASKNEPEELELNTWQENKLKIWKNNAQMVHLKEVKINSSHMLIAQSKIIDAVYNIFKLYPNFRNVTRDGKIFRTKLPLVGVRVPWDEEQLTTIFLDSRQGYKKILKRIIRKTKNSRKRSYEKILEIDHIKELLPPSQCSVVVSYVGFDDPEDLSAWGWGVIDEAEGIPITIFFGRPIRKENDFWITRVVILMDHRVHDGKDLSLFVTKLKENLEQSLV